MKSIGIADEAHVKLKRYCDRNGLGLGEFISASLVYFEKHGINPATHESPADEMLKVIKKLDQVIAFIRKQEQDLLRPMVQAVGISENRISKSIEYVDKSLQQVALATHMEKLNDGFSNLIPQLNRFMKSYQDEGVTNRAHTEKLLKEQHQKQGAALTEIIKFLDKKDKDGLMGKVSSVFK
jgi:hypothetical protein